MKVFRLLWALLSLTVAARAAVVFSESFTYADGVLTAIAADKWATHSGTAAQADIAAEKLNLTEKESEDINAVLVGAPYATTSGAVLYAGFKVNFTALPSGAGGYFAHFKDTTTGFRARVFASTAGAAAGSLRLGIAATTTAANYVATDLTLGTTHTVVVKHDVNTGTSVLWVDPTAELDPGVATSDATSALAINAIGFRQSLSSGAGMGVLTVDDLIVATTFAEALGGSAPAVAPTISTQPKSQDVAAGADVTFTVVATGTAPLAYQWQYGGADLSGQTSATLTLPAVTVGQAGQYRVVVSNLAGTATSEPAILTVSAAPVAPVITQQPANVTADLGASAIFTVVATGTAPLAYRWQLGGTDIPGATASTFTISNVKVADVGTYRVIVSNTAGPVVSDSVTLTVTIPPPANIVTNIAHLRTQVDPVKFTPTNVTQLYTVEGTVTTWVNLTTPTSVLFYIQDPTAGIAVFVSGSDATNCPPAGAQVRVTGPLGHFSGLLELNLVATNAAHVVEVLSKGNALPAPKPLAVQLTNDIPAIEALEGSLVSLENVVIDSASPNFPTVGANVNVVTGDGENFIVRVDARVLDILGQTKPVGLATVIGVLGQFDNSDPRTAGYQLTPTRYVDIVSAAKPPGVRFTAELAGLVRPGDQTTNSFTDQALRPGEKLTLRFEVTDPEARAYTVAAPSAGLPASGVWTLDALAAASGGPASGTFTYTATEGDAGKNFSVTLEAKNAVATSTTVVNVYVPTPAEQRIILTEFYANPTATATAPNFNPLHRPVPQEASTTLNDEFLELVNLGPAALDLVGWTISDGLSKRHQFYASTPLAASNVVVVFGGPLNTNAPVLAAGVLAEPASEGGGLALNNDGDTIVVRNGQGRVVTRVVYAGRDLGADSSLVRSPGVDNAFTPHRTANPNHATPGLQPDGRAWTEPGAVVVEHPPVIVTAALVNDTIALSWNAVAGATYSVHRAATPDGPYARVATSLPAGNFSQNRPAGAAQFYRVTNP